MLQIKNMSQDKITGYVTIVAAIIFGVVYIIVAASRLLTQLENVLLQLIILFLSIGASFAFGRESANSAGKALIKPYARSAFRRSLSLYFGLSRFKAAIQDIRQVNSNRSRNIPRSALDKLEAMATDLIYTAVDSLGDWHDIVPEDVDELLEQTKERQEMENGK